MRKLFIALLILAIPAIVSAKTATVTYTYNGAETDTVAIVASETPDFTATLSNGGNVVGAMDVDKDNIVSISNLVPGTTYYFSAVAWDINGVMTGFAPELVVTVPAQPPLVFEEFPTIEIDGKTITFSVTVE